MEIDYTVQEVVAVVVVVEVFVLVSCHAFPLSKGSSRVKFSSVLWVSVEEREHCAESAMLNDFSLGLVSHSMGSC